MTVPALLGMVVFGAVAALDLAVGRSHAAISSHAAVSQTIHAFVHVDSTIGLTFDDGTPVGSQARATPTIPAGTYVIRVIDDTSEHNFHLLGTGVEQSTEVGPSGTPTWTVTLVAGSRYQYVCDAHPEDMYGYFQAVGAGASSSSSSSSSTSGSSPAGSSSSGLTSSNTSPSSASSTSLRGTLAGSVGSTGKLTLTLQGKPVSRLKAGRYKLKVVDTAKTRSFVVAQIGRPATTVSGVSYVGTRTVTVTLASGSWSFYSSAGTKSKTAFTVNP